jgi:hypothetical protein
MSLHPKSYTKIRARAAPSSPALRQCRHRDRLAAGRPLVSIELDADTLDGLARLGHDVSSAEVLGRVVAALLKASTRR